jgi:ribosomal protein S18 acetylase RimI-like enzyme
VAQPCDIRNARKSDAGDIAKLYLISSDGLAAYIWSLFQTPGVTLEEVGRSRYARAKTETAFSYENCRIAERNGEVAGMLHGYPMHVPEGGNQESDPVLKPYAELELDQSFYISGVAVYETFRGLKIGNALMADAFARAKALGLNKVSLICFEGNEGAVRLYRRLGFAEIDRRPIVPHPALHYRKGDAILMAREVEGGPTPGPFP